MPVSLTAMVSRVGSPGVGGSSAATSIRTSPRSVNLIALAARLDTTWRRRTASPLNRPSAAGAKLTSKAIDFSSARARINWAASSTVWRRSNGATCSAKSPASSFDWSRMSESSRSSTCADDCTSSTMSRCSWLSGVRASTPVTPMTPFRRRTDLMAHVGHEGALGVVGALGDVARVLSWNSIALRAEMSMVVPMNRQGRPSGVRATSRGARQHPFGAAVLAEHPHLGACVRGFAAEVGRVAPPPAPRGSIWVDE